MKIIKLIIGNKVWEVSQKMANATLEIAKQKYEKENVNAIYAVEKDNIISMQNDVYNETFEFNKAIENWTKSGYKCHFTSVNKKRR